MRPLNGKRLDWTYQFNLAAAVAGLRAEIPPPAVISALVTATAATIGSFMRPPAARDL
jgi:hypothetical protein